MHLEAYEGFKEILDKSGLDKDEPWRILDFGGQDVNSTGQGFVVYEYFTHPEKQVVTLDLYRADIIADAAHWEPDRSFDVVMATELFEHTPAWRDIVAVMRRALDPEGPGMFLATCASIGRNPHGSEGAERPAHGEWYGNVAPQELEITLKKHFSEFEVTYQFPPGDVYAWAVV